MTGSCSPNMTPVDGRLRQTSMPPGRWPKKCLVVQRVSALPSPRDEADQLDLCNSKGLCYTQARSRTPVRLFPDSSAVEHSTVNRMVAGSNPAPGASPRELLFPPGNSTVSSHSIYHVPVTRQITSPTSSATRSEPSGPSVTPTGRPYDCRSSGERKPLRISRAGPEGRPFSKGTKTTL